MGPLVDSLSRFFKIKQVHDIDELLPQVFEPNKAICLVKRLLVWTFDTGFISIFTINLIIACFIAIRPEPEQKGVLADLRSESSVGVQKGFAAGFRLDRPAGRERARTAAG